MNSQEPALEDVARAEAEVTLATGAVLQARHTLKEAEARLTRAEALREAAIIYYNRMNPRANIAINK